MTENKPKDIKESITSKTAHWVGGASLASVIYLLINFGLIGSKATDDTRINERRLTSLEIRTENLEKQIIDSNRRIEILVSEIKMDIKEIKQKYDIR
jgi:hypothetical protein